MLRTARFVSWEIEVTTAVLTVLYSASSFSASGLNESAIAALEISNSPTVIAGDRIMGAIPGAG